MCIKNKLFLEYEFVSILNKIEYSSQKRFPSNSDLFAQQKIKRIYM